jgi:uncharacterized protein (DUF2267 family)
LGVTFMGNRGRRSLLEGGGRIQVDNQDLLARVQHRSRLHGRNESRRAVCAVVEAIGEFLSPRAFHLIAELLPEDVRRRLRHTPSPGLPTCRSFLAAVRTRLLLDGPDATFAARIVLEELNATGRVITPARFVHLVAPDLRALLCAQRAPITVDDTNPAPRRTIRVGPAATRPAAPPAPGSRPAVPPPPVTRPSAVPSAPPATVTRPAAIPAAAPATATRPAAIPAAAPATATRSAAGRPAAAPGAVNRPVSATRP